VKKTNKSFTQKGAQKSKSHHLTTEVEQTKSKYTCFVEPDNSSALLGAAAEELCICIISFLLAPSTALHCSVAPGFAACYSGAPYI